MAGWRVGGDVQPGDKSRFQRRGASVGLGGDGEAAGGVGLGTDYAGVGAWASAGGGGGYGRVALGAAAGGDVGGAASARGGRSAERARAAEGVETAPPGIGRIRTSAIPTAYPRYPATYLHHLPPSLPPPPPSFPPPTSPSFPPPSGNRPHSTSNPSVVPDLIWNPNPTLCATRRPRAVHPTPFASAPGLDHANDRRMGPRSSLGRRMGGGAALVGCSRARCWSRRDTRGKRGYDGSGRGATEGRRGRRKCEHALGGGACGFAARAAAAALDHPEPPQRAA